MKHRAPKHEDPLHATASRGDADLGELQTFFQPGRQFAGNTLWTCGTSLKSAYVGNFEFLNAAPVVQLWRDRAGTLQAVSRINADAAEWFCQVAPRHRNLGVMSAIIEQADAVIPPLRTA